MRTIKLVVFIILLAGLSSACKSPFGDKFEKYFVINDTLSIQSVQISGDSDIIMKRIENEWLLEDGALVNQVAIDNLLLSFTRLEKLSVIRDFEESESNTVLFNIETLDKNYSFSFIFSDNTGYIGRIGDSEVYRFGLKGIPEINLKDIFSDNKSHWKNPTVVDMNISEIMEIYVIPNSKWGEAFEISKHDGEWSFFNDDKLLTERENVDMGKLSDYSRNFSGIYFEREVVDKEIINKTFSAEPFFTIKIINIRNEETILNIYSHYDEIGEYDDFYALMTNSSSESLYLVNYVYLDPMFESFSSFLLK